MDSPAAPLAGNSSRHSITLGWILCAVCIGAAINVNGGNFDPRAINLLTLCLLFSLLGIFLPRRTSTESFIASKLPLILALAIALETVLLFMRISADGFSEARSADRISAQLGIVLLGILGIAQVFKLGELRQSLMVVLALIFFFLGLLILNQGMVGIDVVVFQVYSSSALLHGVNPYAAYAVRFPNIYGPGTPFYAPRAIDSTGKFLTFGFPYPPLSLLMSLPGHIFGDCRFSDLAAATATGFLMYLSRAGRIAALAAAIFMLTPQGLHVLAWGWTEPLLALTFSLAMFCACRKPQWLPWALGLYFATKQYTVLSLPALWLLVEGENRRKKLLGIVVRAGLVVLVITLPFFLWNPREFIRSVALWQLIQPFRPDAMSYLVWFYNTHGQHIPPIWIPLVPTALAIVVALWRCPRTPAGFAAAVTLINLTFFAFNKQAFCNYYYFVVVTACWAVAAIVEPKAQGWPSLGFTPISKT